MGNDVKTALYEVHKKLQGRIISFAGFEMPVWYTSIIEEHLNVREKAGIFDLSHMGELFFEGNDVLDYLQSITPNDISAMNDGDCQYNMLTTEKGTVVDDMIIYKYNDKKYMIIVNAANIDKDVDWFKRHLKGDVRMTDACDDYSLVAIQGPNSIKILEDYGFKNVEDIKHYTFRTEALHGIDFIFAATGYTGERGFELIVKNEDAVAVWDGVYEAGQKHGMLPIGLGARDTLRMEVCYPLYGNDIDDTTTPLEANLKRFIKVDKGDFVGRDVLKKQLEEGLTRKLRGFVSQEEKGVTPRHGAVIVDENDNEVGTVTSGAYSPCLKRNMGMAYISTEIIREKAKKSEYDGKVLYAQIRKKKIPIVLKKMPLYSKPK